MPVKGLTVKKGKGKGDILTPDLASSSTLTLSLHLFYNKVALAVDIQFAVGATSIEIDIRDGYFL